MLDKNPLLAPELAVSEWFNTPNPLALAGLRGVGGLSKARIEYRFKTVLPSLLTSLAGGTELPSEACYADP
jgi:hypothetical protein